MSLGRITTLAAAVAIGLLTSTAHAAVLTVDDDGLDCFNAPYTTIAAAVNDANAGDQIMVCPGLYAEQVVITKRLSLVGQRSGSRAVTIRPTSLPQSLATTIPKILPNGNPVTAGIVVDSVFAIVSNVDVDMSQSGVAGCTPLLAGIYFRNTSGSVTDTLVKNVQVVGHPECDSGVGLFIESGQTGDHFGKQIFGRAAVRVERDLFIDYQKAGFAANGVGTVVKVRNSKAVGIGLSGNAVQNGFQIGLGAHGKVLDSAALGHASVIADKTAAGFLLFGTQQTTLRRNSSSNGQTGFFVFGNRNRPKSGEAMNMSDDGLVFLGDSNTASNNSLVNAGVSGAYVDGNSNLVRGGVIADSPVGVWLFDGNFNRASGIRFSAVPEEVRSGGVRDLTRDSASPVVTFCRTLTDCDDGNACTTDVCDVPSGLCSHTVVADNTPCPNASVCDGAETCLAGVCVAGTLLNCDDGNPCTVDSCDPVAGCQPAQAPDGTPCSDPSVCNGQETCQAGACTAGTALTCDDGNPCTIDTCDAVLGCRHAAVGNGISCTDGNACNGGETCQNGACTPGTALNCDDVNPCTVDSCDASLGCQHAALADGSFCLDGSVCNGSETCQAGICTAGTALNCDDGNACTTDGCNAIGGCTHAPIGGCQTCTVNSDCNDANPCTTDVCSGGACQNNTVANGTPCADGTVCNGAETCQAGACTAGSALNCDDGNPCTTDTCDAVAGCQHPAVTDGTSCADSTVCNGAETCLSGVCSPGSPLNCDDGNPCTADSCNAIAGCQYVAATDGTPCPDGTACNGAETCLSGACVPGIPLNCDDLNPCTTDSCDPALGCLNPALADGTPCPDGTVCNGDEICSAGTCMPGTPPFCSDGNACTTDTCDPTLGCQYLPVGDGTVCDDGDTCTTGDSCQAGTCTGTPVVCTLPQTCDPATGTCI